MSNRLPSRWGPGSPPAAVVFDCDGVLIESVNIKTEAFTELFAQYPQHLAAIVDHHQTHLGISRFEKFEWIYRELLGRELADDESVALGSKFSELVFDRTLRCPEVPGAGTTLSILHEAGVALFVASGTPQDELESIIAARGWELLFDGIHGSPRTKTQILGSIAEACSVAPSSLAFVGDGWSDYQAALGTGATFILRETVAQTDRFSDFRGARVPNLIGLQELLPNLHMRSFDG